MAGLETNPSLVQDATKERWGEDDIKIDHPSSVQSTGLPELDVDVHRGLEFPTDEERETLRRVSDSIPWTAFLIAIVEMAERFSFYGCSVVFTNFIQQPLPEGSRTGAGGPEGQSGALGMGQRASTGIKTFFQFWCYVVPLFGAYVADTYFGRYNTVCWSVLICIIGHIILIISAIPGVTENAHSSLPCFLIGIIIIGLGTGGFKANISPLVAEQYRRTKLSVITTKNGERVIVDPALTTSRIYLYFYLFINVGALIGQVTMTYAEKYVGFYLAFTLPTIVFFLSPIVLLVGRNRYHRSPPTGSVLPTALRILRVSARGCISLNPAQTWRNFSAPDFWDAAKPSRISPDARPKWMTFDDLWVDEVSRGFKACTVFLWYPIYWLTYTQLTGNLTSQAATMSTHGVPNDVLGNLDPLALIILIPICDLIIYPALIRAGVSMSQLKRISWGFYTASAAMVWAAVVQHYIYKTIPCHQFASTCLSEAGDPEVSPLNVWIQSGSYILIAISEIFASITGLEYAFTKAPKNMRSLVMAVFLFAEAFAAALAEAFVSLSADPLLVWNYGTMAVIAFVAGTLYVRSTRSLDKREDQFNNMAAGHFDDPKHRSE